MEKAWFLFGVNGVGRVAAWVDMVESVPERVLAENLTLVIPAPNGVGFSKLSETGTLNLAACGMWCPLPSDLKAPLSELWDKIIVAEKKVSFRD